MKRLSILALSFLLILFCGCGNSAIAEATKTPVKQSAALSNEAKTITDMFAKHGTYDGDDDCFRFTSSDSQYDIFTIYTFAYQPSTKLFYCSYAAFEYGTSSTVSDAGSVYFSWGDMKNAYFEGRHILYDVGVKNVLDSMEFKYAVSNFSADMKLGDYTYEITKNTFSGLSNNQLDIYAVTGMDCLIKGVNYAQGIISTYESDISIW